LLTDAGDVAGCCCVHEIGSDACAGIAINATIEEAKIAVSRRTGIGLFILLS
jgi:hypothetical protein